MQSFWTFLKKYNFWKCQNIMKKYTQNIIWGHLLKLPCYLKKMKNFQKMKNVKNTQHFLGGMRFWKFAAFEHFFEKYFFWKVKKNVEINTKYVSGAFLENPAILNFFEKNIWKNTPESFGSFFVLFFSKNYNFENVWKSLKKTTKYFSGHFFWNPGHFELFFEKILPKIRKNGYFFLNFRWIWTFLGKRKWEILHPSIFYWLVPHMVKIHWENHEKMFTIMVIFFEIMKKSYFLRKGNFFSIHFPLIFSVYSFCVHVWIGKYWQNLSFSKR